MPHTLAQTLEVRPEDPHHLLVGDGLVLADVESGDADRVGFGTGQDDAVRTVAAALGDPIETGLNEECGAGPLAYVDYQGGLRLYFQAGEFAGWSTRWLERYLEPETVEAR